MSAQATEKDNKTMKKSAASRTKWLQVLSSRKGVSIDQSGESPAGMDSLRVSAEDTRKPKEAVSPNKEEKPVEIPYIITPYRV